MDALAALLQRHYATVCKVTLSDELAVEMAAAYRAEIYAMADALAGPDRPGETFHEKWARLATADATAESEVLRENLPTGVSGGDE